MRFSWVREQNPALMLWAQCISAIIRHKTEPNSSGQRSRDHSGPIRGQYPGHVITKQSLIARDRRARCILCLVWRQGHQTSGKLSSNTSWNSQQQMVKSWFSWLQFANFRLDEDIFNKLFLDCISGWSKWGSDLHKNGYKTGTSTKMSSRHIFSTFSISPDWKYLSGRENFSVIGLQLCNSAKFLPMSIPRTRAGHRAPRKLENILSPWARGALRGKMLNITEVDVLRIQIAFWCQDRAIAVIPILVSRGR